MSFPTIPSFTRSGAWNSETRAHPAMKFMENFTKNAIDNLAYRSGTPYTDWYTDGFVLQKANGEIMHGGKKAWEEGLESTYGPFKSHFHDPNFLSCVETNDGWRMVRTLLQRQDSLLRLRRDR
ncbi:hypothetical protein P7C71_g4136, partial [Lecanoromycetidae sp. Uapishka_2]